MSSGPDGHGGGQPVDGLGALDGPAEQDLRFSGPGDVDPRDEDASLPEGGLPGGVDHTTAAVGAGSLGLVLLGIAGAFKRRSVRRRYETLDD